MYSVKNEVLRFSHLSLEEDFLVQQVQLTHDPDGRRIDSRLLLQAMENIMLYATVSSVPTSDLEATPEDGMYTNEIFNLHESLAKTISTISQKAQYNHSWDQDLHERTMMLLDSLRNFTWDAKVVIALAAFATSYGEFWLIVQLYDINPLASSVALLRQLPNNLSTFGPRFKALSALVKRMVDVTKCIIEFEDLQVQNRNINEKSIFTAKSDIYVAAYWVIRSTLICSSLITDLIGKNQEESNSTTIAAWEMSSLLYKLSGILGYLQKQVAIWHVKIEDMVYQKLLRLNAETHKDNQETLSTLFSLREDMPLKCNLTKQKLGVSKLRNKVVILLISKPDMLPMEDLFFLVQQTCSVPTDDTSDRSYEIIWVPISSLSSWSNPEIEFFNHLSNTLPWYAIRKPWLLSSAVLKYIKQVWGFTDEPLMVVLDRHGIVSSPNSLSMVFTWGSMAYPFSSLREQELWKETNWSLKLVIGGINPLLSMLVEQGKRICLYGSNDLVWIREFTGKIKGIIETGVEVVMVYVGMKKPGHDINNILAKIAQEKLSGYLSLHDMHLFWLRLENIRRSILRLKTLSNKDHILKEVMSLMSDNDDGWALFGEGFSPDIVQYHGSELMECLTCYPVWAQDVGNVGFLGALRSAFEPPSIPKICSQCNFGPFVEGSEDETVSCEECKSPMERFVIYQCQGTQ